MAVNSPQTPATRGDLVKRGLLYGAALGMLAGLLWVGIRGGDAAVPTNDVVRWRNAILLGSGIGLLAGAVWPLSADSDREANDHG